MKKKTFLISALFFSGLVLLSSLIPNLFGQTKVSGPSQVKRMISLSGGATWYYGTIDFATINSNQCRDISFVANGVVPGMAVVPGWPSDLPQGVYGMMYTGADVVVVRLCALQTVTIPPLNYSGVILTWR
ncbi:MAG: hypothetical protein N3A54_01285 [Patescibacteria group bacterium]|nr:hypothetical protein [Patescibacteria group bacterium]